MGDIGDGGDIYSSHHAQQISLNRRNSATSPSGIYHCDIPTNAFHDDTNFTAVYVGLYANRGNHSHWQVKDIQGIFLFSKQDYVCNTGKSTLVCSHML